MRIIHYVGGAWSAQRLVYCWWRNKARLEALGLCVVPWLDLAAPMEKITRDNLGEKLDNPQIAPKLRQWFESTRGEKKVPRALFHSDPLSMSYRHERFKLLSGLLQRYFPEAEQNVLLLPAPADLEIEAALSRQFINGGPVFSRFAIGAFYKKKRPRLRPLLEDYEAYVGPDNVRALIWHEDNTLEREFMLRLTRAMDLGDEFVDDFDLAPNRVPPVWPRDILWFLESVNPLLALIEKKPTPFKWTSFPGFWRAGCLERVMLPDELRQELRAKHDPDDEAALRERFGFTWEAFVPASAPGRGEEDEDKAIFAETGPEAGRSPGYADALRIAKKLPQDFLRALADGPHPEECFQRAGTRLCLAAIREAVYGPRLEAASTPRAKVAVLTATYNHAAFIAQNIESVLAQKINFPVEHIIADDGSTDGTQEIVLEYAARYPHIRPVFQKNRSNDSRNYQSLFEAASAPYVAICEGDDYFSDENKLQTQYDFLEANQDCGLHFHRVRVTFERSEMPERIYPMAEHIPGGFKPFYELDDLVRGNMIQTNSVMYRWRFPGGMPLWYNPYLMPADWYMHLLHAEIGRIAFSENIMSVYRRHSAAQFYLTEVDKLKHRVKYGKQELRFFKELNRHFLGKYLDVYQDLAIGVFVDLLLYGEKTGDMTDFEAAADAYPEFALPFLKRIKIKS